MDGGALSAFEWLLKHRDGPDRFPALAGVSRGDGVTEVAGSL